jgi:hypothetical protein
VASADPKEDRKSSRLGGRISLQTLIIASIASAAASFAASRIWGGGTIVSAAATPVIVALVSEFLRRPVQTVAETARKVPTVQTLPAVKRIIAAPANVAYPPGQPTDTAAASTDTAAEPSAVRDSPSGQARPGHPDQGSPPAPPVGDPGATPPAVSAPSEDPGTTPPAVATPAEETGTTPPAVATPAEETGTTTATAATWRPRWRLAIVTGLLAFAIVVAIYTVPDLLAGRSITGSGQPTTFFGVTSTVNKKSTSTTTVTTTAPTTTVTKTSPTTTVTRTTSTSTTSTSTSTSTTPTLKPPGPASTQTTTTATTSTTPAP